MNVSELAGKFPNLWHITFGGGWDGIQRSGILRAAEVDPEGSGALREDVVEVDVPDTGMVTLRNQLHAKVDPTPYLDGISPTEWWQLINGRAYFFCREVDADVLLQSYLGQGHVQEVIKVRTKPLLDLVADDVSVATVNAGAFPRAKGPSRGPGTFVPLADFPLAKASTIREITVAATVPLTASVVTTVMRHEADGEKTLLHR